MLLDPWTTRTPRRSPRAPVQIADLQAALPDCATLLSALAYLNHPDAHEIERAFAAGRAALGPVAEAMTLLSPEAVDDAALGRTLNRLQGAAPDVRRKILDACAQSVLADGTVTVEEGELLRMIALLLHGPVPDFLRGIN